MDPQQPSTFIDLDQVRKVWFTHSTGSVTGGTTGVIGTGAGVIALKALLPSLHTTTNDQEQQHPNGC